MCEGWKAPLFSHLFLVHAHVSSRKNKGFDTKECIVGCIGGAVKNFRRYLLTIDCFRHVSQFCRVRGFRFWQHSFLAVCLVTHSKVKPNLLFYCKHFLKNHSQRKILTGL